MFNKSSNKRPFFFKLTFDLEQHNAAIMTVGSPKGSDTLILLEAISCHGDSREKGLSRYLNGIIPCVDSSREHRAGTSDQEHNSQIYPFTFYRICRNNKKPQTSINTRLRNLEGLPLHATEPVKTSRRSTW